MRVNPHNRKYCKTKTDNNKRCKYFALIDGYCVRHFNKSLEEKNMAKKRIKSNQKICVGKIC